MSKRFLLWTILLLLFGVTMAQADSGVARHNKLYAVPTPGKVVIDGKLDDWDHSAQITMYATSETEDVQNAKFALMYDAEALYVSAVVRDATPMMNRKDPKVNGDTGWDGDSCQIRIVLDPAQGYPRRAVTLRRGARRQSANGASGPLVFYRPEGTVSANEPGDDLETAAARVGTVRRCAAFVVRGKLRQGGQWSRLYV